MFGGREEGDCSQHRVIYTLLETGAVPKRERGGNGGAGCVGGAAWRAAVHGGWVSGVEMKVQVFITILSLFKIRTLKDSCLSGAARLQLFG